MVRLIRSQGLAVELFLGFGVIHQAPFHGYFLKEPMVSRVRMTVITANESGPW